MGLHILEKLLTVQIIVSMVFNIVASHPVIYSLKKMVAYPPSPKIQPTLSTWKWDCAIKLRNQESIQEEVLVLKQKVADLEKLVLGQLQAAKPSTPKVLGEIQNLRHENSWKSQVNAINNTFQMNRKISETHFVEFEKYLNFRGKSRISNYE